jgi:predicted ester cyclase
MAREEYLANLERLLTEGYGRGDADMLDTLVASSFVDHGLPESFPPSAKGAKDYVLAMRKAMPDLHYTIEDSFLQGSRAALRATGHGTMSGSLFGHPASGKAASWTEIHIFGVEGGKLTDHWAAIDWLKMFQEFGLVPGLRSVEI